MPKVTFSREDVLQRTQLDAGWYPIAAKEINETIAKDKVSTNYVTDFIVLEGPMAGVPVRHWFTEKAVGRIVDYVKCFLPPGAELETGKQYELEETLDRPVMGYISYDATMKFNKIEDFRAMKAA